MKKIISIILVMILTLCMFGCGKNNVENGSTTAIPTVKTEATKSAAEISAEGVSDLTPSKTTDEGGGTILPDKYRLCYYNVPYHFSILIDKEEFVKWQEEVYTVQPNDTNQMIIKRFVEDFNISREVFDETNHAMALKLSKEMEVVPVMNPQDYTNQEMWEVYNADIIYTFDDEIINAYYLSHPYPFLYESEYEDAVLAGTYRTQTTDFYFPELDSHSSFLLRGFEYPEEATVADEPTTSTEYAEATETTIADPTAELTVIADSTN